MPPFTTEQFLDVFRRYNEAVWPAPVVLVALALLASLASGHAALRAAWRPARVALAALAALWLWTGVVYFFRFFAALTPAGRVFGSLFVAEAALLLLAAWRPEPMFAPALRPGVAAGLVLVVYALAAYPVINYLDGHRYPALPTFGAPCPVTILTLGIFCLIPSMIPRAALVIPLVWAAIGSTAAFKLGVPADLGLLVAGAAAVGVVGYAGGRARRTTPAG